MNAAAYRAADRRDQCRFLLASSSVSTRASGRILTGQVDGIGAHPSASATGPHGEKIAPPDLGAKPPTVPSEVLPAILPWARERLGDRRLAALGHRVVHGGMRYSRARPRHARIAGRARGAGAAGALARAATISRRSRWRCASIPNCRRWPASIPPFTAPRRRSIRPLRCPIRSMRRASRRYGFHGLSYEYIASVLPERAPEIANGRVVVAHLGNGCSACAMRNRVSIATTMGFTALDGLPMGTRCGELDAGVVLYLIQQKGMSPDEVVDLLYRRSGMLGLSGISSDFRELLASDSPRARFAVEVFCNRVARHIASLAAALGGLDGIVFTAGVGENAAPVRERDLPRLRLAGGGAGRSGQPGRQGAHQHAEQPRRRLCDEDRREPDDRPPCPRAGGKLKTARRENHVRKSRHDAAGEPAVFPLRISGAGWPSARRPRPPRKCAI